jgi:chemotaxis protein MotB
MAIEEEPEAGIPEWVVTFGDMMSLLLTFFIMLVSMSEIKKDEQFQAMVESMRQRFGYDSAMASMAPGSMTPRNSNRAHLAVLGRAQKRDSHNGGAPDQAPVGDNVRVETIKPPEHLTEGCVVLFPQGSAELTEEGKRRLQSIIAQIAGKPQKIEVRGHTTMRDPPPDSPYRTNWDLAYARAKAVMDHLVNTLHIDRRRIQLNVAAGNEPSYTDPTRLERNARVEVYMLDELRRTTQPTTEAMPFEPSTQN